MAQARLPNSTISTADCFKVRKLWQEGYPKCDIARSFGLSLSGLNCSMRKAGVEFGERNHKADPERMSKARKKGFGDPGDWRKTVILPPKKDIFVPWTYRR